MEILSKSTTSYGRINRMAITMAAKSCFVRKKKNKKIPIIDFLWYLYLFIYFFFFETTTTTSFLFFSLFRAFTSSLSPLHPVSLLVFFCFSLSPPSPVANLKKKKTDPTDGMLFVFFGDGGSANDPGNRAQNTDCWMGKILRLNVTDSSVDYTIPTVFVFVFVFVLFFLWYPILKEMQHPFRLTCCMCCVRVCIWNWAPCKCGGED